MMKMKESHLRDAWRRRMPAICEAAVYSTAGCQQRFFFAGFLYRTPCPALCLLSIVFLPQAPGEN
jgi:hypothetical protein